MSHSRKRNSYGPNSGSKSNKKAKQENNRRLRRIAKYKLFVASDHDAIVISEKLDEVMNRWEYPDDGKAWYDVKELLENGYPQHQLLMK